MKKRIVYILFFLFIFKITYGQTETEILRFVELIERNVSKVTLTFVGDIMCHGPQLEAAKTDSGSYDFRRNYHFVEEYLSAADITFGNLETVIYPEKKFRGYPLFNSPPELLQALKNAGFDYLFTSNNHSFDKGFNGVISTIREIGKVGMVHIGSNENDMTMRFRIIYKNGIKIALYAFTWSLNGFNLPEGKDYLVNLIDFEEIKREFEEAKKYKPDINLIYLHFGDEYNTKISPYQKTVTDKLNRMGFDIIIGSHPHVLQKIETVKSKNNYLKNGFIAYSLGNFISNQRWRHSDGGIILNFDIYKNQITNKLIIDNIKCIPVWVYKGKYRNKFDYYILPTNKNYNFLSEKDKYKIKEFYKDTIEIIDGKYIKEPENEK